MKSRPGELHTAQMAILRALSHAKVQNFSALQKAAQLTSDHANFHIKKLVERGYVRHVPKSYGEYMLTREGKRFANTISPDALSTEAQAKLSVVLWIKDASGRLLRQERTRQPYYGYWTRPTGKVRFGETVLDAAARKLKSETGLTADLTIIGIEHRTDKAHSGELLDDKYLFMVEGTNPQGTLLRTTPTARNHWLTEHEYAEKDKRFGNAEPINTFSQPIVFTEGLYLFDNEDY